MEKENKETKQIPLMEGLDTRERLNNLVEWRDENLSYGYCLTLQEIGTSVGLSRERVRQIEAEGLKKLRHPAYSNKLKY